MTLKSRRQANLTTLQRRVIDVVRTSKQIDTTLISRRQPDRRRCESV